MTWSDPPAFVAGNTLTAAQLNSYVSDNLTAIAEWTAYTPTVTQSGAVTKTVTYAKYRSFGGTVHVQVLLDITGSGTGNNTITVSLPVTAATSDADLIVGHGMVLDQGTNRYMVAVNLLTTGTVAFWRTDTPSITGQVGVDPNFALANTDVISFTIEYPAA